MAGCVSGLNTMGCGTVASAGPGQVAKKLSRQAIIGQEGVNIVERACLKAGLIWRPTAIHDVGTDGQIEIRDASTGTATGRLVACQIKTAAHPIAFNRRGVATIYVSAEDIEYWKASSLPFVIFYVDTTPEQIYWRYVKEEHLRRTPGRIAIEFQRDNNRLTVESIGQLVDLATKLSHGVYVQPPQLAQTLMSNLLPLDLRPPHAWVAPATVASIREGINSPRLRLDLPEDLHKPVQMTICSAVYLPAWSTARIERRCISRSALFPPASGTSGSACALGAVRVLRRRTFRYRPVIMPLCHTTGDKKRGKIQCAYSDGRREVDTPWW